MMKVLIGYDGSQSADAALADLQRAGLPKETEALIVSVADVMMVPETSAYELAAEALMSRRVAAGLVYAQRQAQAGDADSIFVGGRRFNGALERFQLGSVATALVTKAHCPVEVVRSPAS